MLTYDLSGKVAFVTGASGAIGSIIAYQLSCAGAKVGVHYHSNKGTAEGVVNGILASDGEAILLQGNVSHEASVEAMVKQLANEWGRIDILVNNAGINRDRLLLCMSPGDWDEVLDVNLRGAFLCTKYVMSHLIKQRSGRVVNISSVVGLSGNPGQANYAASKAGLIGFTKAVAREVASRGITVNAIAPGLIKGTGMMEELKEEDRQQILARIPMERFGSTQDVAEAVLFLCGKGAGYITGQVLIVDGGMIT